MALQIILVIETDEKSRSDYIYISSVLDKWYNLRMLTDVKITPIFMRGKGNYTKKRIANVIEASKKNYSKIGETVVIFCFDTDKYDSDQTAQNILSEEEKYCKDRGYEFVWFCHDIEEVFLGESIPNTEKTARARKYASSRGVNSVNHNNLRANKMAQKKSNLMTVLDKYLNGKQNE